MQFPGKVHETFFEEAIRSKCGFERREVLQGPGYGVDVAVVELPGGLAMAIASDPLSLVPSLGLEESAWLSVQLMANDIGTTGFAPQYAQFVLNLPVSLTADDFRIYWDYIHQFCAQLGVSITGGHTGFAEGINSTIAGGGTMITVAPRDKILLANKARSGNVILVTKVCALSSSAILGMSFPQTIVKHLGKEVHDSACDLFFKTSSVSEALVAAPLAMAMHDVTEGGVLGAITEMAQASGIGAQIFNESLPCYHFQKEICKLFELDPRFCIGAGSMIVAADENKQCEIIEKLAAVNIDCCVVGKFTAPEAGVQLVDSDGETSLFPQVRDPYWDAYYKAIKNGWK